MSPLRIRQHKSAIGEKAAAKGTLSALGLGKPGAEATHDDSVTVRGMIRRVAHLVEVTESKAAAQTGARPDALRAKPVAAGTKPGAASKETR